MGAKKQNDQAKRKKSKSMKSGTLKRVSHASSTTRRRQAQRDFKNEKIEFETIIEPHPKSSQKIKRRILNLPKRLKYVNIKRSPALDVYVRKKCNTLLKRINARPGKYRLKFSVRPEARSTDSHVVAYKVTGAVIVTARKEFNASAEHYDVHDAIDEVVQKLEKKLHRDSEKRESSRRTLGRSKKSIRKFLRELARRAETNE